MRRTRKENKNNDNQMKHDMAHCQQFILSLSLLFFFQEKSEEKLFLLFAAQV